MELLRFTVRNQNLSGGRIRLVSDSIDYVEAFFDFRTDDWEGLSKWAHFTKGEVTYDINLADDRITGDMNLNLDAGTWELRLHGTDFEGTKRITTDTAYVIVEAFGEGFNPLPDIPLSAAEQIDAKSQLALDTANAASGNASEAIEKATEVYEAAQRGDFNGKDGEKGEPGVTPEIQIGNVATVEPGGDAMVTIGGTAEKPILNFAIPKGDKETGIKNVNVEQSNEEGGTSFITIELTDDTAYGYTVKNGSKGETGSTGLPGLVWQGEWNAETAYSAIKNGQISRDVVFYNGSAYVVAANSPAPVTGVIPEGDTTGRWELLVLKGEKGEKGDAGEGGSTDELDEKIGVIEEKLENAAEKFTGSTEDTTPQEVMEALVAGKTILLNHNSNSFGIVFFANFAYTTVNNGVAASVAFENNGVIYNASLIGFVGAETWNFSVNEIAKKADIPEEKITTAVDLSGYENGTVVEAYSDGSTNTYTFTFDADGNPVKITDSNGNETVLTW